MVKSNFQRICGPKPERFSHSQFCLEIQTLHGSAGKGAFGLEPVHDQRFVVLEHLGHFFHGLKFCAHSAFAPVVQEPSRDRGVLELPEALEVLPEKIGLDRLDVELQEIGEAGGLVLRQVLRPFQESPAGFFENGLSLGLERLVLLAPDPVDPAPEETPDPFVQLVDHREVLVAPEYGNLVDSDLGDPLQGAVVQAIVHHVGDGPIDTVPARAEDPGRLAPGEPPGPTPEKELVVVGQVLFPRSPGKGFDMDPVESTVHTAGSVEKEHLEVEEG